eukprot:TRINITY_DN4052_c0_g1_i1.p1 TRINITY_DN4052_c0_g1~~TRINITY_DN4052_c0_g1_i1.p1  ORF type:complete len:494 (-),score=86.51 TRINITY_DN4052_c0_g1_i1:186-1616(-)
MAEISLSKPALTVFRAIVASLCPSKQQKKQAKSRYNRVVQILHQNFGKSISSTAIAGSVAKATALSTGFDVDTVVFYPDFNFRNLKLELDRIEACLKQNLGQDKVEFGHTPYAVQLRWLEDGTEMDVLIGRRVPDEQLVAMMDAAAQTGDTTELDVHSASLCREQVRWMKQQMSDPACRLAVLLAKLWRNRRFSGDSKKNKPASYLIELLVIHAYTRLKDRVAHGLKVIDLPVTEIDVFVEFLRLATEQRCQYLAGHSDRDALRFAGDEHVILDPVNRLNNVADRFRGWAVLRDLAAASIAELRSKPADFAARLADGLPITTQDTSLAKDDVLWRVGRLLREKGSMTLTDLGAALAAAKLKCPHLLRTLRASGQFQFGPNDAAGQPSFVYLAGKPVPPRSAVKLTPGRGKALSPDAVVFVSSLISLVGAPVHISLIGGMLRAAKIKVNKLQRALDACDEFVRHPNGTVDRKVTANL